MSLPVIEFNINLRSPVFSGRTLTVPVRSAFTLTATIKDVDGQLMDLEGYTFQFRVFSRTVAWIYLLGHDVTESTTRASFDIPDDALELVGNLRYGFEVINPDGSLFVQNIGEIRVLARDDVGVAPPPPPPDMIVNSVDGETGAVDLSGSYLGLNAKAADVDPAGPTIAQVLAEKADDADVVKLTGDQTIDGVKTFKEPIESLPGGVDQFDVSSSSLIDTSTYTVGALNGQDTWAAGPAYDVYDFSGGNIIRLSASANLNNMSAIRALPVASDTSYHFRLFFPGGTYTNTVALRLRNSTTDVLRFNFTGDGAGGVTPFMEVAGFSTAEPWDQSITTGVWYDMVVTVLQTDNTMRVYIKPESAADYTEVTIAGFPQSGWQLSSALGVNRLEMITWANVSGFQELLYLGPLREFDQIVPLPLITRWIDFKNSTGGRLLVSGYDSGTETACLRGFFEGVEQFKIEWGVNGPKLELGGTDIGEEIAILDDLGSMALEDAGDYLGINATAADVDPTGTAIAGEFAGKANIDGSNVSPEVWRQELSVPSIADLDGLGDALVSHINDEDNPHRVTAAQVGLEDITQAEAEAGAATTRRAWTAQRVRQAINAVSVLLTGNQTIDGIKTFLQRLVSSELRARTDDGLDITKSDGTSLIRVGKHGATKTGVAMGQNALAAGQFSYATGRNAVANGDHSAAIGVDVIADGGASLAQGSSFTQATGFASIASGITAIASQTLSYARGRRARSVHAGASVESDNQNADFESTAENQKSCRYAGGYRFMGGAAEFESGVILKAPNDSLWKLTVNNDGNIITEEVV